MAKGAVPMADILDILDSFPMPESRYDQRYRSKRERLTAEATIWHHKSTGGDRWSTTPLHGPSSTTTSPCYKRNLSRTGGSCLRTTHSAKLESSPCPTLVDVRQLEPYIIDSYPKGSIVERFVDRLDADIRDIVIAEFRKRKIKWYWLLDIIAEHADRRTAVKACDDAHTHA